MHLQQIRQKYPTDRVEVAFIISRGNDAQRASAFPQLQAKVAYRVLDDRDDTVVRSWGLHPDWRIAKNLVIDTGGTVRFVGEFATAEELAPIIDAALSPAAPAAR